MLDIEYPTEDTTISVAFTPSQFELLSAIAFIESRTASEQAAHFLKLVLEQHGLAPVTLEQIMGLDEEVEVVVESDDAFLQQIESAAVIRRDGSIKEIESDQESLPVPMNERLKVLDELMRTLIGGRDMTATRVLKVLEFLKGHYASDDDLSPRDLREWLELNPDSKIAIDTGRLPYQLSGVAEASANRLLGYLKGAKYKRVAREIYGDDVEV